MAKFLVNSVLTIPERLPVFICGTIISGEIKIGDHLLSPENKQLNLSGKISAIEFMDMKNESFLCLGVDCHNQEDQKTWLGLKIKKGDTLEINTNT